MAYDMGMRIDASRAERVRQFFHDHIRHIEGDLCGKPFDLIDWQYEDIIFPIFSWIKPDGTRRFMNCYVLVAKKNGKSTLFSAIAIYGLIADGEARPEIYTVASTKMQAGIIFDSSTLMCESSDTLSQVIYPVKSKKELHFKPNNGVYKVLSSDGKRQSGYKIHMCLCDETHEWVGDGRLWGTLKYGGASRKQPLFLHATTAGEKEDGLWYDFKSYTEEVLDGSIIDPTWHGVIYEAKPEDNLDSPTTWKKANPSLGHTLSIDRFAMEWNAAKQKAQDRAIFKRYRFNIVTSTDQKWVDISAWDACKSTIIYDDLIGCDCFAAFDISSKIDLAGFTLFFPRYKAFTAYGYIPLNRLRDRAEKHQFRLDQWVEMGFITPCNGSRIDYDMLANDFIDISSNYNVKAITFDVWNAAEMMNRMEGLGYTVLECPQTFSKLTEPMKELEAMILAGEVQHFGNPALRWCVDNIKSIRDSSGNERPSKKHSRDKIDLAVSAIMSVAGYRDYMSNPKNQQSVYETQGLGVSS